MINEDECFCRVKECANDNNGEGNEKEETANEFEEELQVKTQSGIGSSDGQLSPRLTVTCRDKSNNKHVSQEAYYMFVRQPRYANVRACRVFLRRHFG